MTRILLPRRTFLQGAGVSLMLPALEAMFRSDAHAATGLKPRFAAFFHNLGIYGGGYNASKTDASRYFAAHPTTPAGMGAWRPSRTGPFGKDPLPLILQPLEALKDKMTIVSGLSTFHLDPLDYGTNHSGAATAWLTAAYKSSGEANYANICDGEYCLVRKNGITQNNILPDSIDQHIANALGFTPGSSIVFNNDNRDFIEWNIGGHTGYVSYNSKLAPTGSTLVPKSTDPKKVFDALFGKCGASATTGANPDEKSLLDFVMSDIKSIKTQVGVADRARLEAYFSHIRDLEVSLNRAETICPSALDVTPPRNGTTRDWVTNTNMMADVVALALASGTMPVATLMTNSEAAGGMDYQNMVNYVSKFIGLDGNRVTFPQGIDVHNDITHGDRSGAAGLRLIEQHIAYSQTMFEFARRLIAKLDSFPVEPNGLTPLDNSVIIAGASHSDPYLHSSHNLPLFYAGGKGFGLVQGQHVALPMRTDIGLFHATIAKAMGVLGAGGFNGRTNTLSALLA